MWLINTSDIAASSQFITLTKTPPHYLTRSGESIANNILNYYAFFIFILIILIRILLHDT